MNTIYTDQGGHDAGWDICQQGMEDFILIFKGKDSIDEDGQGYKPADYSRR